MTREDMMIVYGIGVDGASLELGPKLPFLGKMRYSSPFCLQCGFIARADRWAAFAEKYGQVT